MDKMEMDTSEIQEELKEIKEDIDRIIYWWRRYKGIRHKDTNGKFYSFKDLDLLEKRLEKYFENPQKFDFDEADMGISDFGFEK